MPDRVKAVASLAANAPIDAAGLDWTAGLGEANLESFEAMRRGRDAHEEYLRNDAEQLRAADPNEVKEHLQSLLTPVDRTALTLELTEYFTLCWRDALRAGIDGWCEDERQADRPWGFRLDDIRVPVLLWHGRHDLFVPFAHGEWLAEHIPGVDARLSDEDGHLTLFVHRIPELHAWLLGHA
jgi:pimeloyl-ACP methyl ester carboxylesterase